MTLAVPESQTYFNVEASGYRHPPFPAADVGSFHRSLATYNETQLHHLPKIIRETDNVFLKDESTRFGLPAFKILGASWAVHQTLIRHLRLPLDASADAVAKAAQDSELVLVTSSAGNWGRAVARTASLYGLQALIYVPSYVPVSTRNLIQGESIRGQDNIVCTALPDDKGSYDDSLDVVRSVSASDPRKILVCDTSWDGYTDCPAAVTEGYATMLTEVTHQLGAISEGAFEEPTHVIMSVGVGSWAHAVVAYYSSLPSSKGRPVLIAVEPENATCLLTSLRAGRNTSIATEDTIMTGMNCGTTSEIAWPVLKRGIDCAVAVSDLESHQCVQELQALGISVGPCGAAPLAALRKLIQNDEMRLDRDSCVVLFSTEGSREYKQPDMA